MHLVSQRIYLDYNASAPLLESVRESMAHYLQEAGNPSSVHTHGRRLRKDIEKARHVILEGLKAPSHKLCFTSGATEANALILHTIKEKQLPILVSAIEHNSILENTPQATVLPVSNEGLVNLEALEAYLKASSQQVFVSVMAANNETGVIQPLAEISALCVRYGALFHVDAAQAIGRMPLDLMELAVDYVTLSAHKMGGPPGIGALILHTDAPLASLYKGGGQEEGYRAGTLNWLGIMAFATAFQEATQARWDPIQALRDKLENHIQTYAPGVKVAGKNAPRLPNTSCFSMPKVPSEAQIIAFDLEGISISAGSACSSGKIKESHVLKAMGFESDTAATFIRVSLCPDTSVACLKTFINTWEKIYHRCTKESLL